MALSISDLIAQQVGNIAGNVALPANQKNDILNGLSNSILGSLTQTATKAGGLDMIKQLLTGQAKAETSPITALAGTLFKNNVIQKLGLNANTGKTLIGLIPAIFTKLGGFIKDQDGDGDVDLNDILITLKGGNKSAGGGILGGILGGIFKK
jgi:hypothetical protein